MPSPVLTAAGCGCLLHWRSSLVKISSWFLFLEDQIRVGDVIEIAGKMACEKINYG